MSQGSSSLLCSDAKTSTRFCCPGDLPLSGDSGIQFPSTSSDTWLPGSPRQEQGMCQVWNLYGSLLPTVLWPRLSLWHQPDWFRCPKRNSTGLVNTQPSLPHYYWSTGFYPVRTLDSSQKSFNVLPSGGSNHQFSKGFPAWPRLLQPLLPTPRPWSSPTLPCMNHRPSWRCFLRCSQLILWAFCTLHQGNKMHF